MMKGARVRAKKSRLKPNKKEDFAKILQESNRVTLSYWIQFYRNNSVYIDKSMLRTLMFKIELIIPCKYQRAVKFRSLQNDI